MKQEELLALVNGVIAPTDSNSVELTVTITSVTDWRPAKSRTGELLPTKMVKLSDGRAFWPLASAITNLPAQFTQPLQARVVLTVSKTAKDASGKPFINMTRCEFDVDNTVHFLMVKALPKGAALFALAN